MTRKLWEDLPMHCLHSLGHYVRESPSRCPLQCWGPQIFSLLPYESRILGYSNLLVFPPSRLNISNWLCFLWRCIFLPRLCMFSQLAIPLDHEKLCDPISITCREQGRIFGSNNLLLAFTVSTVCLPLAMFPTIACNSTNNWPACHWDTNSTNN